MVYHVLSLSTVLNQTAEMFSAALNNITTNTVDIYK